MSHAIYITFCCFTLVSGRIQATQCAVSVAAGVPQTARPRSTCGRFVPKLHTVDGSEMRWSPVDMGISLNGGTPKWMVYNGQSLLKCMIWGYHHFRKPSYGKIYHYLQGLIHPRSIVDTRKYGRLETKFFPFGFSAYSFFSFMEHSYSCPRRYQLWVAGQQGVDRKTVPVENGKILPHSGALPSSTCYMRCWLPNYPAYS